jgi:glucose dehydrogenase
VLSSRNLQASARRANTRGWDAVTGKVLWQFHSVPHPGESGNESRETPDSWKDRSGTNVWGFISVDPETGQVHIAALNDCDWSHIMAEYDDDIEFLSKDDSIVEGREDSAE